MSSEDFIKREFIVGAHTYTPLPVVLCKGEGVWLWDVEGKKYLDMMSAYSAVGFGHANKRLIKTMTTQAERVALTSRAYHTDQLAPFLEKACELTGFEMAMPMNSGAEGVETAVKVARRWGYECKGIEENKAEIIVAENNFHGRTTTIISFSTEAEYKRDFGPFTPGFKAIPFGDAQALEEAITDNTCAFLVEPIQGEAGIIVPPDGWLKEVREICTRKNVLFILDEIQSGMGRTGKNFAFQHEDIQPDGLILGKALGGGLFPVSLFLSHREVISVMTPGSHGSTFGGNPLACAIGTEALTILEEDKLAEQAADLGMHLKKGLQDIQSPFVKDIRGKGLWVGVELDAEQVSSYKVCKRLMEKGVLSKDTHAVVRFAPPLIIEKPQIDFCLKAFKETLEEFEK